MAAAWTVTTRTRASTAFGLVAAVILCVAVAAPVFLSRGALVNLFTILTLLSLAQCWNLLAGYAGLVSVGQQAFVGFGAYAMFALVILAGIDPVLTIPLAGVAAALLSIVTAFFVFRLQGAYFAIGTWVVAEVVRLVLAQWKVLGGGTGTSLPSGTARDMLGVGFVATCSALRAAHAADIVCYLLALVLACLTIGYGLHAAQDTPGAGPCRLPRQCRRGAGARRRRQAPDDRGLGRRRIHHRHGRRPDLHPDGRISPNAAFAVIDWTAYVIFIVVIGGIGTIEGPIVGVLVFFLLQNTLSGYGSWYLLVLGLIGIVVMLFAPRGLWASSPNEPASSCFRSGASCRAER